MRIPKLFKLFNHVIEVKDEDNMHRHRDLWGEARYRRKEIALETDLDAGYKQQTFLHELIHMIFNFMGEETLQKDEKFINLFSELLYQAIETMEYED